VDNFTSRIGAVILAAGASVRMGRPKLLLPWRNTSVLGHVLGQWAGLAVGQVALVCAPEPNALCAELDRLGFSRTQCIVNPQPGRGMFSSVQSAAAWKGWKPELTHWVITLADQPHLRRETLQQLIEFAMTHAEQVCQPLRHGHRRHPLVVPRDVFLAMAGSSASDLKAHLASAKAEFAGFESADAGLDLDIDTPGDYQRALKL
jgi:molybdenum cofactor cytidylyltransferase